MSRGSSMVMVNQRPPPATGFIPAPPGDVAIIGDYLVATLPRARPQSVFDEGREARLRSMSRSRQGGGGPLISSYLNEVCPTQLPNHH